MPIYPKIKIDGRHYIETEDAGSVVIESITKTADPEAPEIIYRSFVMKKRWKQIGNCYRCGLLDFGWIDGVPKPLRNIVLEDGKRIGEKYSVRDFTYDTRKDIPNGPNYVKAAKQNAKDLGVPYICGLQFEILPWVD